VLVRKNVMRDILTALLEVANIHARACPDLDHASQRLEQAQLAIYFIPAYAGYGAIVRAVETDRLPVQVQWTAAREADHFAEVFSAIFQPAGLPQLRAMAPSLMSSTRTIIKNLERSLEKGQKRLDKVKVAEEIADIPIALAEGAALPPQVLFGQMVVDAGGFANAHKEAVATVAQGMPDFVGELIYLHKHAPRLAKYLLDPAIEKVGLESIQSFDAKDLAFIIGRTIRAILAHGGSEAVLTVLARLVEMAAIVTIVHIPSLVTRGIAHAAAQEQSTAERLANDPEFRKKIRDQTGKELPPDEMRALAQELIDNGQHVKRLAAAGETVGPPLAAIVTDIQGEGKATQAQAKLMLSDLQMPLLDLAP
jgi:hypothetical protein